MYGFSSFYMFRRLLRGGGTLQAPETLFGLIYKMIVLKQILDYRSLKFIKGSMKS